MRAFAPPDQSPSALLVTGAAGRVGLRLVRRLGQQRRPVRALVRSAEQAAALSSETTQVVVGDLRNAEVLADAVHGVSGVIHLAAAFRGVAAEEANAINFDATVALAFAAVEASVDRFVFVSTTLVYGPGRGRPLTEADELWPEGYGGYPAAKAATERALHQLYLERGLPLRTVRLAFVYGDGDPHLGESLTWARQWPPHRRLQLIHHADVAQGLLRALDTDGLNGRTYHLGDDNPVTAYELLAVAGEKPDPDAADRPLPDPWDGILDTSRARTELGFRPLYPTLRASQDAGVL